MCFRSKYFEMKPICFWNPFGILFCLFLNTFQSSGGQLLIHTLNYLTEWSAMPVFELRLHMCNLPLCWWAARLCKLDLIRSNPTDKIKNAVIVTTILLLPFLLLRAYCDPRHTLTFAVSPLTCLLRPDAHSYFCLLSSYVPIAARGTLSLLPFLLLRTYCDPTHPLTFAFTFAIRASGCSTWRFVRQ